MTWADADDRWAGRNRIIARAIRPGSRVIDLGAGAQGLRELLRDCEYTPADIVPRSADSLYFDMNNNVWPRGKWDVAVLSGVLEYAANPRDVLAHVRFMARECFVSYRHRQSRADKEAGLFLNNLSRELFASAAHRAGWRKMLRVGDWQHESGKHSIWRLI